MDPNLYLKLKAPNSSELGDTDLEGIYKETQIAPPARVLYISPIRNGRPGIRDTLIQPMTMNPHLGFPV